MTSISSSSSALIRQIPLTCSGHTRPVVDLAFSQLTSYGYFLISACKDGKPMLRQGDTGDWIGTFLGHKGAVWGVAITRSAELAATAAADYTAKVFDAISGEEKHSFTHNHIVKSVDFNRGGSHLLTASNEKLLRIYDLNKPEAEPEKFSGHTSGIKRTLFLPSGRQVISAADDKTIRLWDCGTREEVRRITLENIPSAVEVTEDGSLLLITYGHKVAFYSADSWELIKEFSVPTQVNSASLHPDKSTFVCGGEDFKVYKLDYDTGIELESFKGHFGPVHCIRYSPDGEIYATGSEDGTLRLWQTTVGKTYGLWKFVSGGEELNNQIPIAVDA